MFFLNFISGGLGRKIKPARPQLGGFLTTEDEGKWQNSGPRLSTLKWRAKLKKELSHVTVCLCLCRSLDLHCLALRCFALLCFVLHCFGIASALHCITLHCFALHWFAFLCLCLCLCLDFRCFALPCFALLSIVLLCIALRLPSPWIALPCFALHCDAFAFALHWFALHCLEPTNQQSSKWQAEDKLKAS